MFSFIKKIFGTTTAAEPVVDVKVEAANSAPYKVEAAADKAVEAVVKSIAPAKKKPAPKKAPAKKVARKPKAKPAQ